MNVKRLLFFFTSYGWQLVNLTVTFETLDETSSDYDEAFAFALPLLRLEKAML